MDEIYEQLNPRIPIEYVLFSFLALSIVIVLGMLMMKWGRVKKFLLGSLLSEYYFLVLCSTVICRGCGSERRKELVPFWNYADIWNRVDYPTDLIEVLLNIALFMCRMLARRRRCILDVLSSLCGCYSCISPQHAFLKLQAVSLTVE